MIRRSSLPSALLCAASLAAPALAQDAKPAKGIVEDMNPRAPTTPLKVELTPFWCSICIADGTLPKPTGEPYVLDMMNRPVDQIMQQIDVKENWIAVETPHFKIFSTLRGAMAKFTDSVFSRADFERLKTIRPKIQFSVEGAKLDPHDRVHLYQIKVERAYAHFAALTACDLPNLGMPKKYELFLWDDFGQHNAFCSRYIGRDAKIGLQHHEIPKDKPDLMVFTTSEAFTASTGGKADGVLANYVMHNVAHLMIDGYHGYFRETPAWLEEGLGHFYARRENPRYNYFCWAEGKSPGDFIKPDWETTIFSMVRRDKDNPFTNWCDRLQPGELTGQENGFTWGIVKWLIDNEPIRFTKMIEKMDDTKLNLTSQQMIQDAYGVSPSVLYQRWREFVIKNWAGQ